jgi:hypothetical protein
LVRHFSRRDRKAVTAEVAEKAAESAEKQLSESLRLFLAFSAVLGCPVRMRRMSGRAFRISARVVFFICGVVSLLNALPYALLRGVDLPVQSEWVIFVVALGLVGILGIATAVMPRSKFAKWCKGDQDDPRLFATPLKILGVFAATSYGVALFAYFAPHTLTLNPQLMLALCPLYFVRMTIDPSPVEIFFLLAPINAAVYGALGVVLAYACLASRGRTSNSNSLHNVA